jgi:hypothetical protein
MTSTLLEVQFPHKMNLVRRTTAATISSSDAEVISPPTTSSSAARKEIFTKSSSRSESFGHESSERVIEEKRKRANGQEGYSVHQYTVGRMLGKGGFAKVYLCTAMDTGKNYAVKVVPKENLVKARARQKVRYRVVGPFCCLRFVTRRRRDNRLTPTNFLLLPIYIFTLAHSSKPKSRSIAS